MSHDERQGTSPTFTNQELKDMLSKNKTAVYNTQQSIGKRKVLSGDSNFGLKTGSFNATNDSALDSIGQIGMLAPEPGQSFHVMSNFENEA